MRSLHSYVDQLRSVISQCRAFHGFEEDYLDGVQPTWCSLPYYGILAYRLVEEADTEGELPKINTTLFVEVLQIMAPKHKLAGMYAVHSMVVEGHANDLATERCLELLELPKAMST
jgi:hypothetical protein